MVDKKSENIGFAERVIKSFNTHSFKRYDSQIKEYDKLIDLIGGCSKRKEPISFIMYWGKGASSSPKMPEREALKFLGKFFDRFKENYPYGYQLTIVATDTHIKLNNSEDKPDKYFDVMTKLTKEHPVKIVYMSQVLGREIRQSEMDNIIKNNPPDHELYSELVVSAKKHYKGAESPESAALHYYAMNIIEGKAIQSMFGQSIFLTYN